MDLSAYVFDGAALRVEPSWAADRDVTRAGDGLRRWVLVEPGVGSGAGFGSSAQVALHARKLGDVASPRYSAARVTHVMPIPYAVPADEIEDLDRWYTDEHVDKLLRCDAWLRVRRYEIEEITGARWNRLVVHDLAADDVLERDEVRSAMATPWRRALADRPWFVAEPRAALRVQRGARRG
jgi:hypothetical protein